MQQRTTLNAASGGVGGGGVGVGGGGGVVSGGGSGIITNRPSWYEYSYQKSKH